MHASLALYSALAGLSLAVIVAVVGVAVEEHVTGRARRERAEAVRANQHGLAAGLGVTDSQA